MRIALSLLLISGLVLAAPDSASAAGYCPNQPNGKCPATQKSRPAIPQEQRAKYMESARLLCKKKYGAEATVYRIDYSKPLIICTNNTR